MHHYRCIILIIATNDTQHFINCRNVWKKYMNLYSDIKIFFIYGKLLSPLLDKNENDLVFDSVVDSNVATIHKSLLAMKYISCNYTYDYLIRTNLSTFWNIKLLPDLLDKCPKNKCYSGAHNLSPFYINNNNNNKLITTNLYSGICIIFTPDIVDLIFNNLTKINFTLPDDISIGLFMSDFEFNSFTTNNIATYEKYTILDENQLKEEINKGITNNYYLYRVKNNSNRELTDFMIYKLLLKSIYDIECL